jgi:hypothetical protein
LALVYLWAYLLVIQLIVIWESDLAHEIHWYLRRSASGWQWVAGFTAATEFVVPFLVLIWRPLRRSRRAVLATTMSILAGRLAETWWLTIPDFGRGFVWADPLAFVAIDINPASTPRQAADFAEAHGFGGPGMTVLIGDEAEIRRLADAAGFPYRRDPATEQYAHPAGFFVATPNGLISRYLLGFDWRPFDLQLALMEATKATIAAPTRVVLLFCYCYDPQTGATIWQSAGCCKSSVVRRYWSSPD